MLTRQEMFDRAVIGLRSQGFERCVKNGSCVYDDGAGRRCAWGWVDPSLTTYDHGSTYDLIESRVGLAAGLRRGDGFGSRSTDDALWARRLQRCHDDARDPEDMENGLRAFASNHGLTFPEAAA